MGLYRPKLFQIAGLLLALTACASLPASAADCPSFFQKAVERISPSRLQVLSAKPETQAPMIALGFFDPPRRTLKENIGLREFADRAIKTFDHPVVTYYDFPDVGYTQAVPRSGPGVVDTVKSAIESALLRAGGERVVLFNLDGFDLRAAFQQGQPRKNLYTAQELQLIFSDPRYFNATRWFQNGKELNEEQVRALFGEYFPEMFKKP